MGTPAPSHFAHRMAALLGTPAKRAVAATILLVAGYGIYALAQAGAGGNLVPPALGLRVAYTAAFFAVAWVFAPIDKAFGGAVVFFISAFVLTALLRAAENSSLVSGPLMDKAVEDYVYPGLLVAFSAGWISLRQLPPDARGSAK